MSENSREIPAKARLAFATVGLFAAMLLSALAFSHGCGGAPPPTPPARTASPAAPSSLAPVAPDIAVEEPAIAPPVPRAPLPTPPSPRAMGFLGRGPWAVATWSLRTPGMGILEAEVLSASTDEAQNVWVVTRAALYVRAPGDDAFRRFTLAGPLAAVQGGAPDEAFVGYESLPRIDYVKLVDGALEVHAVDVRVSGDAARVENHGVRRFAYDHFARPHTLFAGFPHGLDLMLPGRFSTLAPNERFLADHVHPRAAAGSTATFMAGEFRAIAIDAAGDAWFGGRHAASRATWSSEPMDFLRRAAREPLEPLPVFDGEEVSISAAAVAADGRVFFASDGAFGAPLGLASLDPRTGAVQRHDAAGLFGSAAISDLAALPDGRLVVAPKGLGLSIWDPSTGRAERLSGGDGLPSENVRSIQVDAMVSPPAVYVATDAGLWVGRGL